MNKCNVDITNQRFGNLVAIKRTEGRKWICRCDCGKEVKVSIYHLLDGHTKSCGHTRNDNFHFVTHNLSHTHLYQCYHSMLKRCKYDKDYKVKNIDVCKEWKNSFINFKDWAISHGYEEGLTLERKDVYKDYCPANCCWIEKNRQPDNRSNTIYINYNGKTKSLKEWSQDINIPRRILYARYYKGWDAQKMLTQPLRKRGKYEENSTL